MPKLENMSATKLGFSLESAKAVLKAVGHKLELPRANWSIYAKLPDSGFELGVYVKTRKGAELTKYHRKIVNRMKPHDKNCCLWCGYLGDGEEIKCEVYLWSKSKQIMQATKLRLKAWTPEPGEDKAGHFVFCSSPPNIRGSDDQKWFTAIIEKAIG